jgi:hypothetical protein
VYPFPLVTGYAAQRICEQLAPKARIIPMIEAICDVQANRVQLADKIIAILNTSGSGENKRNVCAACDAVPIKIPKR